MQHPVPGETRLMPRDEHKCSGSLVCRYRSTTQIVGTVGISRPTSIDYFACEEPRHIGATVKKAFAEGHTSVTITRLDLHG